MHVPEREASDGRRGGEEEEERREYKVSSESFINRQTVKMSAASFTKSVTDLIIKLMAKEGIAEDKIEKMKPDLEELVEDFKQVGDESLQNKSVGL